MRLSDLVAAVPGARPFGADDPEIRDIALDSRRVSPGALFVAVAGTRDDGHGHIADARARGACAVALEHAVPAADGLSGLLVRDGRRAAGWLAAKLLGDPTSSLSVCGVTGTNGKTTTTWYLRSILEAAGAPTALFGTICNDTGARRAEAHLTTPDAAALQADFAEALAAGRRYAAMEVSSHALVQGRVAGTRFRAGVLTNVTRDHLDYHKTVAAYRAAKGLLFSGLAPDAVAVLNADDPATPVYAAGTRARVWRYGTRPGVDVRLAAVVPGPRGVGLRLDTRAGPIVTTLALVGRHNAWNAAAAATTALALGVEPARVSAGLAALTGVPGRLERAGGVDGVEVFVDFAHTPAALDAVLASAREMTRGRLICVFGCGGDRDRGKRPEMAAVVERRADAAWLTSDNPRTEDPSRILDETAAGFSAGADVVREPDRTAAIAQAIAAARPGDVVVIAGKGHEREQIVGVERRPFDDGAVAREALAQRASALGKEAA